MTDPFKDAICKNVSTSFDFIAAVEARASYEMESLDPFLDSGTAETYLEDDSFMLAFRTIRLVDHFQRDKLWKSDTAFVCRNDQRQLAFTIKSFAGYSIPTMEDPHRFECPVREYHTPRIGHDDHFFRAIIPTKDPQQPATLFESAMLKIAAVTYMAGLVKVYLGGHNYHLFAYSTDDGKRNHLFVESIEQINYHVFRKALDIILLSYAFVTGYFARDRRHIIGAEDSSFTQITEISFETLPNTLSSKYSVIPTSAVRTVFRMTHEISFPQSTFNDLCERLQSHSSLAQVILVLVEGHSLSIELRAAVYSVALEAITDIVSKENESKFTPIPQKPLARNVLRALLSTLESFKAELSTGGLETLEKKLRVVNSPTNRDKLLRPFALYRVNLTAHEIDCIEKRNDFLHGRFPFDPGNIDQRFQLEQTVLVLLYCVTTLILKYIGYSGSIIYYPAFNEYNKGRRPTNYFVKSI